MRNALTVLLWIVALPVAWPVTLWRSAWHERRHRVRGASVVDEARVLAAIPDARCVTRSTRGSSTMASGYEEDVLFEVETARERLVASWTPALQAALAHVPTRRDEGRSYGIGGVFATGLWIVSILAWSALGASSWPLAAVAALALLGLFLLALS